MSNDMTATGIEARFACEVATIKQHVRFIQDFTGLDDGRIADINWTLRNNKIPTVVARPEARWAEPFSAEEIRELLKSIDEITPQIKKANKDFQLEEARSLPIMTPRGTVVEHPEQHSEWVNYLIGEVPNDLRYEDLKKSAKRYRDRALNETEIDAEMTPELLLDIIYDALVTIIDIQRHAKSAGFQRILEEFEVFRFIARYETPDSQINLYRQGFILLVTAFDAAIFDLVRVKLRSSFFEFINVFGNKEKISLDDFQKAGSFEQLREQIIENQLKAKYLKDLLIILAGIKAIRFGDVSGQSVGDLIEIVLRRNIHVHNRGRVDQRYLEIDHKGKTQFNLYDFKIGDIASVDETYWGKAIALCEKCVAQVLEWSAE